MKIRDLIVLSELLYMPKQIRDHDIHILNSISEKMRIYKCTTFNIQNVNLIQMAENSPTYIFLLHLKKSCSSPELLSTIQEQCYN